ncbi:MAG: hypothetical protein K9M45_01660 [Kiritimatiellales bacterium]|nr:hypothetical protein [Kiritimatiellales bacterium]
MPQLDLFPHKPGKKKTSKRRKKTSSTRKKTTAKKKTASKTRKPACKGKTCVKVKAYVRKRPKRRK